MSYPYPQDRHRDRKEEGEQPYKDAKEAMSQQHAENQAGAEAYGESHLLGPDEERDDELEERATSRLREVGESLSRDREQESGA